MRAAIGAVRICVFVLLCLVLAANLWLIGAKLLLKQDLPKVFGFTQATVISGSMEPAISVGDVLLFRELDDYKIGDIVIFRRGDVFVTHRIVSEQNGVFTTKGDANNIEDDEPLLASDIEGAVVSGVPMIGRVLSFLKTPVGILIIIIIGIVLIELPAIFEKREERWVRQ